VQLPLFFIVPSLARSSGTTHCRRAPDADCDERAANPAAYPPIQEALLTKLKQLSLVSLCSVQKTLAYADLMRALDVPDVRALEDIIISSLYAGLLQGKLDQRAAQLEVHSTMGRDVRVDAASLSVLADRLNAWRATCATALDAINAEVAAAADAQAAERKRRAAYEKKVEEAKAAVHQELAAGGPGGRGRAAGGDVLGDFGAGGFGDLIAGRLLPDAGGAMDLDEGPSDERRRGGKRRMQQMPGRRY
jgi:hypothetical protein